MEEIDWLSYLKHWFPNIARVYVGPEEQKVINEKLRARLNTLESAFQYEVNFYDNFVRVIEPQMGTSREREVALKLLTFLNDQIGLFFNLVNNDEKLIQQLKAQLNNLFQVNGDKYLDKLGELACTIQLMKTQTSYILTALEFKYETSTKGKTSKNVDMLFTSKIDGHLLIIDIFNLSLDFKKIENEILFGKLLSYRLTRKIEEKAFDSDPVKNHFKFCCIQPFIWIFDIDTILKYKSFLENFKVEQVLPILCLRQRSTDTGNLLFDCVTISGIES